MAKNKIKLTPEEYKAKRKQDYQELKKQPGYLEHRRKNQKEYYNRMKDNPEYKAKRKAFFKSWLSKPENRKRFNELLREKNRQRALDRRKRFKAEGLCLHCGKKRDSELTLCASCRDMFHKAHKKYYDKINKKDRCSTG